ncbi:MAG: TIGR03086 family metal-binding protein [Acidimicrobiales bacterium]|nr:TIGR03086 family metal-binding protein [Acidimicrobiales bacterium]
MDPREHLQRVSDLLSGLVEGTDAGRLDDPTPCEDFQVRDLIGHFTMGRFLFAADFAGDTARRDELLGGMPERFGDVLGDDHLATYRDASATLDAAVDGIEDVEATADFFLGQMPISAALETISGDNLVHCWDLARSTGQDFDPPDDLVEATAAFFGVLITDDLRAVGSFGPEVEVPEDASALDRLLGFCGRTP